MDVEANEMKSMKKRCLVAIAAILAAVNIPYAFVGGTQTVDSFQNSILIGQREHCCEQGYSRCALLWKYAYQCASEVDGTHQMRKEILFFNTFGWTFDAEAESYAHITESGR